MNIMKRLFSEMLGANAFERSTQPFRCTLLSLGIVLLSACNSGENASEPLPNTSPNPALLSTNQESAVRESTPNILLIVADDLGYLDPGFMGSEISTPNLDQLAFAGIRFTNMHGAPQCAPARAMLMSGVTNVEAGVGALDDPLRPDVASLPERLQAVGYSTYMAGKWNLGVNEADSPSARGFDRSFALMKAADNHLGQSIFPGSPPMYQEKFAYREDGEPADLPEGWFSSELYTDKLIDYISAHDTDNPWFAYLAYTAPHWPLAVPDDWIDRYEGDYDVGYTGIRDTRVQTASAQGLLPSNLDLQEYASSVPAWEELSEVERARSSRAMEVYSAMVTNMDMHIGRVIELLRDRDDFNNTLIIFASDNGAEYQDESYVPRTLPRNDTDNSLENLGRAGSFVSYGAGWGESATAPFRDLKGTLFSGGTRVPALLYHDSIANPGSLDSTYLTLMDVLPTLMEATGNSGLDTTFQGREVQAVRGDSFWSNRLGVEATMHASARAVPWLFPGPTSPTQKAVVQWPWKLIEFREGMDDQPAWLLFNLEDDPGERYDLAHENPEVRDELISVWEEYETNLP